MQLLTEFPPRSRRHVVSALRATAVIVHRKRRIEQVRNLKLIHKAEKAQTKARKNRSFIKSKSMEKS